MDKNEAQYLVKTTFNHAFNKKAFGNFIHNLLPQGEMLDEGHFSGSRIPAEFRGFISSYRRVTKIRHKSLNLDVLDINLSKMHNLENARAMQRGFVSSYLDGRFGGELKDAALAAFHNDDSQSWRFSLIYKDYIWDDNGPRKAISPARRFSYLVGPTEPCHTAESQLSELLADGLPAPSKDTLERLKSAFAVEEVSKQFFNEYKHLFYELSTTITEITDASVGAKLFSDSNLSVDIFAKRLLGQLVFLYFLQKKGWLGVQPDKKWGQGPHDYLQQLFRQAQTSGQPFFNNYLEPLFYEGLAENRASSNHIYTSLGTRIPFLNGGLFEPLPGYDWRNSGLDLPDALFEQILNAFDRYNFTVREDEPLEKEVAVDPEMLGQVFENLLESEDRKNTGTFYTPRDIVHYMVKESLCNYLDSSINYQQGFENNYPQNSMFLETDK